MSRIKDWPSSGSATPAVRLPMSVRTISRGRSGVESDETEDEAATARIKNAEVIIIVPSRHSGCRIALSL